jgi:hypothetical protein
VEGIEDERTASSAAASGNNAAPAVAATAPTAKLKTAMVAADLRTEYRDFLDSSSNTACFDQIWSNCSLIRLTSRVNHTRPGWEIH